MKALVASAMEQGAFGLSTGLEYTPSGFASVEEVVELAKVAARYGGSTRPTCGARTPGRRGDGGGHPHRRGGGPAARDLPLQGLRDDELVEAPDALDLVERAAGRGVGSPRTAILHGYNTGLSVNFPQRALDGGSEASSRGSRTNPRKEEAEAGDAGEARRGHPGTTSCSSSSDRRGEQGTRRQDPGPGCRGTARGPLRPPVRPHHLRGRQRLLRRLRDERGADHRGPHASPGDALQRTGSPWPLRAARRGHAPCPRSYGTFPRYLGDYVREKKALLLPEASEDDLDAAAKLDLADRGVHPCRACVGLTSFLRMG